MIINKNSWHYKWMKKLKSFCSEYGDDPKSLCAYFWTFIRLNFYVLFLFSVTSVLILWIPVTAWYAFVNHSVNAKPPFYCMIALILFVFTAAGICAICEYINKSNNGFTKICLEMIKASKNKVCPLIRYKD